MVINWDVARRVMLTQSALFPEDASTSGDNCMHAMLQPRQMTLASRCIKGFYQGLKWADEFGIHGGYAGNRDYRRVFLLEDDYILGVFDNRTPITDATNTKAKEPATLAQLIELYNRKQNNFKTLLVLEKANYRLSSSEAQNRQSKFVLDVLYPALEGIRAKSLKNYDCRHWYKVLLAALHQTECPKSSTGTPEKLSTEDLLVAIYHAPDQANDSLTQKPPLRYFYSTNSPFNFENSIVSEASPQWEFLKITDFLSSN